MTERTLLHSELHNGHRFDVVRITYETVREVRGFQRRKWISRTQYKMDGRSLCYVTWANHREHNRFAGFRQDMETRS